MKAYEDAGISILVLEADAQVQYYPGVSYQVCSLNSFSKVTVKAGNVIEFVCEDALDQRGFGRVLAILRHQNYVFLAIQWIIETGHIHPRLDQIEYQEQQIFKYSCFHHLR